MEIVRQMKGNVQRFFDKVEESIVNDVKEATGNSIDVSEIKSGFTYSKRLRSQLGKEGSIKVVIDEYVRPLKYRASFISAQGENILSYETKEIDENHFEIKYVEEFKGASPSKRLNYKLIYFLYKRSSIKKANMLLNNIESMIQ